jgi:TIR domain
MHTVPKVFISYRRADTAGYAGRLYDILSAQFGRNNTYMDLDTIVGGDDFTAVIEEKISASDALVAVIGDRWLTIAEENGSRRLDNPRDFVRIEVAKALERGIRVIPVLVGGAGMPRADDLPEDLRALCGRQALEIRDVHFHPDAQQLIDVLHNTDHAAGFRPRNVQLKRFVPALLSGVGVIIIACGILLFEKNKPATRSDPNAVLKKEPASSGAPIPQVQAAKPAVDVAGKWTATVKYDWGAIYQELFDFEVDGQEVSGIAGFLGDREGEGRTIWNGKLAGNRISFMTKTITMTGKDQTQDKHYYKGTVEGKTIRFTMVTDSSVDSHTPIHFTANKADQK